MITILEIVGIALVFALSFVFGVIFGRKNKKIADKIAAEASSASDALQKKVECTKS